jgi:hypothetical protein
MENGMIKIKYPHYQPDIEGHGPERLRVISQSVHMAIKNIVPGDIAEFGIGTGSSIQAICSTLAALDKGYKALKIPPKKVLGFDSFQGLPAATLEGDVDAPMVQLGVWGEGKCNSLGVLGIMDICRRYLPADQVELYEGWFTETLPLLSAEVKFCLVNIDCDLYESTKIVLDDLFDKDRLSDGCILLFDDYFENRASKRLGQRKAWEECKAKYTPDVTDLPPLKWSSVRYDFDQEDRTNGKEAAYS